jgi:cupin 2 domain-containing protein
MKENNIYKIDEGLRTAEIFSTLFSNGNILIEKIISFGQITKSNEWLEQEKTEWMALLQGEAEILFENDNNKVKMKSGDYALIPSHCRHRVIFTTKEPPCIWLAVHFNENGS